MGGVSRLNALDGLRGVAALGVAILWHYKHFNPKVYPFYEPAYWFYEYGFSLVDLFFVLSGFVFCHVYQTKILNREISFMEFAILRFSRLYPLHLATLFIVLIFQFIYWHSSSNFFVYQSNTIYHFILNLFFLQNGWFEHTFSFNGPSWSVSVEIIAYLFFFTSLYLFKEKSRHLMIFIFFIILGLSVDASNLNRLLLNQETDRVLMGFFMGCLAYHYNKKICIHNKKVNILIFLSALLLVLIFSSVFFGHKILGDWQTVYTILFFPLSIIILLNTKPINSLLSLKPLKYLGEISYSIYLIHFPLQLIIVVVDTLFKLDINYSSEKFLYLYIFLTIALSAVSHQFFEKPMQKYIRSILIKRRH